jgi:hypothetical protein
MRYAFKLWAIVLGVSVSGGQAFAETVSNGVKCLIRTAATADGTELQAIALASNDASGEYEFLVRKSGGSGTSSTSQSGDFEIVGDDETVLSAATIGGPGSVTANLTLWSAGQVVCAAKFPDRS